MTAGTNGEPILAVDLGGTKVAAALIKPQGEILLRSEEPTCQDGPEAGINQIVQMLQQLLDRSHLKNTQVKGIGVGIPAVLGLENDLVIWAPNLKGWREVALRPALEQRLQIPTFIEYDGHTAVLGEWWQGAGRGYRSIAMVIVGTGIGGGLILDGKLYRGNDRLAGAAGWFAMTGDASIDPPQSSALGHWESLAAGPGIARFAQASLPGYPESNLNGINPLTAKEIFEQARAGDPFAHECVEAAARLLGLGIANIVSLVNPEIVILGGSVGRQGDMVAERICEVVKRWAQPVSARSVVIRTSNLGADAGLYGAAYAVLTRTHLDDDEERRRKDLKQ
jgi:glucokinase